MFAKLKVSRAFALELKLSKTLSGLVYLYWTYTEGKATLITAIQNTQAHSEFLTTSIPKQNPRLHKNYLEPLVNESPCLDFRSCAAAAADTVAPADEDAAAAAPRAFATSAHAPLLAISPTVILADVTTETQAAGAAAGSSSSISVYLC